MHYALGPADVFCVLSTGFGSLGYFFVVGGNFHPLFYFCAAPLFLNFMLPYVEEKIFGAPSAEDLQRQQREASMMGRRSRAPAY